jgi:glycosyltransferase involved in cell wall biosynthesis
VRIVILTADYPPDVWSGIGVAVHRQATDLAALGAEVIVLTTRTATDSPPGDNPFVVRIPGDGPLPQLPRPSWIHVHSLALTEAALELRRSSGAKLACTIHTQPWLELDDRARARFWLDAQARLLSACDAVIFLTTAERAEGETLFGQLPRTLVIANGVPAPPPTQQPRAARGPVVFAGRATRNKGIDVLAGCVPRVRQMGRGVRFFVAAGHGDDQGTAILARLAREHGDVCQVGGWLSRDALDRHLALAQLVIVPSRYEPFGLVALEAMRLGTPVLGANVGGLRDTLRSGAGGVLVDSFEPRRWADEIVRVIGDGDLWQALHERGPRFVERHYRSADVAALLLRDVYH